jgi:fluoride exporter
VAWVAIGIGGAVGSMARHAVNQAVASHWLGARFPGGTVVVNLAGSLIIGLLAGAIAGGRLALPLHWREFVFVGLLGGFTTFSTFSLDTLLLASTHSIGYAVLNVTAQVVGGLAAVWLGYRLFLLTA